MRELRRAPSTEQRFESTFRVGDRALRVHTNAPAVFEYLRRSFKHLAIEAGKPADLAAVDEGCILRVGGETELWFDGCRVSVDRRLSGAIHAAAYGSAKLLGKTLRRLDRQRALYAAGITRGEACIAIAAPSGTGKTTLALELLRRGWSSYGDEFLLLDRKTLVAEAVPLAFMVREPTLAAIDDPILERRIRRGALVSDSDGVRTWHDLDIAKAFGNGAIAAPRVLTHLVLLARSPDGVSSCEKISPAALTLELLPHLFVESLQVADIWEAAERFQRVACYRLRASDHRAAADMLMELAGA